jgi:hypothetical protein
MTSQLRAIQNIYIYKTNKDFRLHWHVHSQEILPRLHLEPCQTRFAKYLQHSLGVHTVTTTTHSGCPDHSQEQSFRHQHLAESVGPSKSRFAPMECLSIDCYRLEVSNKKIIFARILSSISKILKLSCAVTEKEIE